MVRADDDSPLKQWNGFPDPDANDYSSGLYRFWLRILVMVNMCTRSCLKTARMASSQRI